MTRIQKLAAASLLLASATVPAVAEDWTWKVTPYAWATDVGVDVTVQDRQVVDAQIPVEDLVEDVDTTAQIRLEAQKGAHGIYLDLFDVNLSDDPATVAVPGGAATFTPEVGMTLLDLGGIFDPRGDQQGFQLLYGTRILSQRFSVDAVVDADGAVARHELEDEETLVDALFGVRYIRPLGNRFILEVKADVSQGGTERTWSAGNSLGFRFGQDGKYTALLGYRHMEIDFDSADVLDSTMTLSGPLVGLRIAF